MQIYLAPLQGLTDWIFRESYTKHIASFDKYFSPFIRIESGEFIRKNQCNDISPNNNISQKPVPQFLGNDYESFKVFEELCSNQGYTDLNINMGCPFSKVSKNHLGCGLLQYPEEIDNLLNQIYKHTKLNISVKCRLGQENPMEFEKLIDIYNQYPLSEIIIHARTGNQQYKGNVLLNDFEKYYLNLKHPVCYNGDITSIETYKSIIDRFPELSAVMIGRGIITNPFLLQEIKGDILTIEEKKAKLHTFHSSLIDLCYTKYSGDFSILKRFVEMWEHHANLFENPHKTYKAIKKCSNLKKYKEAVDTIITDY